MAAQASLYTHWPPLSLSYTANAEGRSYECLFMAMYPFRANTQVSYPETQDEGVEQCLGM